MAQPTQNTFQEGRVLSIDKPLEWTSFQAVNHVKWSIRKHLDIRKIKVGHAGTLDPLASGLLLVCTGKFTKKIRELQELEKEYTGTLVLGASRPSFDMETAIDVEYPYKHITEALLQKGTRELTGEILQQPPVYSALKKDGKPLYEYARKGEEVTVHKRSVIVKEFAITGVAFPEVHFRVRCSKGTYIRSLVHDLGKLLDSGAYLSSLRRTKTGSYNVNNALTPAAFRETLWNTQAKP